MTATAAASMSARTAGQLRGWLSVRHSLRTEAAAVLALYGLYELARGLVVGDAAEAVRHARQLVTLERSTGVFIEERMQDAAHAFPGLIGCGGAERGAGDLRSVRKAEVRAAATMLRAMVDRIQAGELTAPGRVTALLEGAATALEALSGRTRRPVKSSDRQGRPSPEQRR